MGELTDALNALRKGEIILIFDGEGREGETDLVVGSQFVTPRYVRTLRKDGGGLICVAVHPRIAEILGLPFLVDVWKHASKNYGVLEELKADDIPYDEKSSFSITVNHRRTFTGITDKDRALTIRELSRVGENSLNGYDPRDFGRNFRSPGHVVLLRAAKGLLAERQGHTELSVELMQRAGLIPMATICEMLDDGGGPLTPTQAMEYAMERGHVYIEGREIIEQIKL